MKKGTLSCKLFGHKFCKEKVVYDPHYLKLVEQGIAVQKMFGDYHMENSPTDYCVRCGARDLIIV